MGTDTPAGLDFTAWVENESWELTVTDRPIRFTLWAWKANVRRIECNVCDWEFFSNTKGRKWDDTDHPEFDIVNAHYEEEHPDRWAWYLRRPGIAEGLAERAAWVAEHGPKPAPTIGAPITDYTEESLF